MNIILNSKSGFCICESLQGEVYLSSVPQSDPGCPKRERRRKMEGVLKKQKQEAFFAHQTFLIKFITWLSITKSLPFEIIQTPDPPPSIKCCS